MNTTYEQGYYQRVALPDADIAIEAITSDTGTVHTVNITEQWPAKPEFEGAFDVHNAMALADDLESDPPLSAEASTFFLGNVAPFNHSAYLAEGRVQRFDGVLSLLGFNYDSETLRTDDQITRTSVCTYPTIDRLNEVSAQAFGDKRVRFVAHEGGDYSAEDFIKHFIESGSVLVASQQPYQMHDIGDHALGWIALGASFTEFMRTQLAVYAKRAELERQLPAAPAPNKTEREQEEYERCFNPSALVLRKSVRGLDELTGRLPAYHLFNESEDVNSIKSTLGHTFVFGGANDLDAIPSRALGTPENISAMAREVLERFTILEDLARSL